MNNSIFNSSVLAFAPYAAAITTRAHGIDTSKYDLDYIPANATGQLDFVVQRIGYGLVRDEAFEVLLPGVLQTAIRGGYHYLSSGLDWKAQADKFLSYVAGLPYHFFVSDFEGAFNTLSVDFGYRCWQWIDYIQQKSGKPTILYTGRYLYQDYLIPSQSRYGINWNNVELWQAEYPLIPNPDGQPTQPTGRTKPWKMWQYTSKGNGTLYGLGRSYAADLNVYNGSVLAMRSWLNITDEPEPIPTGENMKGTVLVTQANVRDGTTANNVIGAVYNGDVMYGEVKLFNGLQRLFFTKVYRKGGTVDPFPVGANVAVATSTGAILSVVPGDEPVPTKPELHVTIEADGYPVTKYSIKPL